MNNSNVNENKEFLLAPSAFKKTDKSRNEQSFYSIKDSLHSDDYKRHSIVKSLGSKSNIYSVDSEIIPSTTELLKKLSVIAFPVALAFICIFLQQSVILAIIGQRYNDKFILEGIGISNLYVNCK